MAAKAFYEILEDQIRAEVRFEIESEISQSAARAQTAKQERAATSAADRFATWVVANIETPTLSCPPPVRSAKSAYAKAKPSAAKETPAPQRPAQLNAFVQPVKQEETRVSAVSSEDVMALMLLERHSGMSLSERFSRAELKAAWHKAAMNHHPDRVSQQDEVKYQASQRLFQDLTLANSRLQNLFIK